MLEFYDYKILKFLYKHGEVAESVLFKKFSSQKYQIAKRTDGLCHLKSPHDSSTCVYYYDNDTVRISDYGRVVFQNNRIARSRKRIRDIVVVIIPIVISVLALLKSYEVEITSILQSLTQALR